MGTPARVKSVHTQEEVRPELQTVPESDPRSGSNSNYRIWTAERVCAVVGFLLIPVLLLTFSHTVIESIIGVLAQIGLIFWFHKGRHTAHHANS